MTDEILTIEEQFGRKALSYTHQFLQLCKTLDKTSHVLDLCCGYGRHALYLHEQGVRVSACDNELSAIESIRALDIADSELETDICDMSELPYSNATFDAVICYSALHHQCLAKLKNTLAEVKRVCKKEQFFLLIFCLVMMILAVSGRRLSLLHILAEGRMRRMCHIIMLMRQS